MQIQNNVFGIRNTWYLSNNFFLKIDISNTAQLCLQPRICSTRSCSRPLVPNVLLPEDLLERILITYDFLVLRLEPLPCQGIEGAADLVVGCLPQRVAGSHIGQANCVGRHM